MRKKLSVLAAGLLAGSALTLGVGSPAQAQPVQSCAAQDPVLDYVCDTVGGVDVAGWVQHYYETAGVAVKKVYCTVWSTDPDCP